MATEINWDIPYHEYAIVKKIVERAKTYGIEFDEVDMQMDLVACHMNGCPLRLQALLEADDFNVAHDVVGIANHMNRETGKLERCFLPRFYDSEAAKEAKHVEC